MIRKLKPSAYLREHLSDKGNGFALDDLVSRYEGEPDYQDVIDAIVELMRSRSDQSLDDIHSKQAISQLAIKLEQQGR